ncbi:hypothetical protein OsI_22347 [Oryza sativa Indica Group]|uniref:Uncharacterized protein n=1 Tax=Oryza sativa subsp. indica TaxID=39946 RepID=B8B4H0_ORYSI|nr:hypothetical protein OsI_22347 [Oryza sativa Indica Group]
MERDFHMAIAEAEANYANNSRFQANMKTKPVLDKVVRQVYTALLPPIGCVTSFFTCTLFRLLNDCSVGINTLLFVSMVISTVADAQRHNELGCHSMEFQLNDLPRNDFNRLF